VLPSLGISLLDCFNNFCGDAALCGGRRSAPREALTTSVAGGGGGRLLDIATADQEKICDRNANLILRTQAADAGRAADLTECTAADSLS
jgi:hypothetical protein